MYKTCFFSLVVDHRNKQAVRLYAFEQRLDHLVSKEEVSFAKEFRVAMNAVEFCYQCGICGESPDAFLQYRLVACNHDDVRLVC